LRAAAQNMERLRTYRVQLTARTISGLSEYDFDAVATVDREERRELMEISSPEAADTRPFGLIFDGSTVYVRPPLGSTTLTSGRKPWLRMDFPVAGELLSADLHDVRQLGVGGHFSALWGATEPDAVGSEEVRGEETTGYRFIADLEVAAERASPEGVSDIRDFSSDMGTTRIRMQAWLGEDDDVRRLEFEIPIPGRPTGKSRLRLDYFDLGAELDVDLPTQDQVKAYEGAPVK
jgi:hypothetical protein